MRHCEPVRRWSGRIRRSARIFRGRRSGCEGGAGSWIVAWTVWRNENNS
jgi:hypothetical protein